MTTAVFSVVYPGVEPYLPDFFSSLCNQDDKDFAVFIMNDGIDNFSERFNQFNMQLKMRNVPNSGLSPAQIRKIGIMWLEQEGITNVVFADSDDYFSTNRVRVSKELLSDRNEYSAVVNELILFGNGKLIPMLGTKLVNGEIIAKEWIRNANFCGLSNTALRLNKVAAILKNIPDQAITFDWNLYSRLLNRGDRMIYTSRAVTYYRQYNNNVASPYLQNEQMIMRGIRIKLDHYLSLRDIHPWYSKMARQYDTLLKRLNSDFTLKDNYIKRVIETAPEIPFWWEMIKTLEELSYETR